MGRTERDAAYSEYVAARQQAMRRVAYAMCGDWHRADDLLQTALTKLYLAWPRLERRGQEDAYVRRILLSSHLDERRRASTRRERSGLEGLDVAALAGQDATETRDELVTALQQVPRMQRSVIVLRLLCDLSVEQTATELGIGAGTVKSHQSRGLARLRELLDPTPTRAENRP